MVEVIGPAGVGKSRLADQLRARHPRACVRLALWGLPALALGRHALRLAPTCLAAWREGRPFRWSELTQMIRLGALGDVVARKARDEGLIVLDEGPVFALSWFRVFFPWRDKEPVFSRWRDQALARWGALVDAVVYLDAPDPVLVDRIRRRRKPHMVKASPRSEICAFVARFRQAFRRVLGDLIRTGAPSLLAYRLIGDEPAETVATTVLRWLEDGDGP